MNAFRTLKIGLLALGAGVLWSGLTAGTAVAADGYGAVAGQQTGGGSSTGGTLPFTGSDLLAYVLVAAAIATAGVVLRSIAGRGTRL